MASLELRGSVWHLRWRDRFGRLRSKSTGIPTGKQGDKAAAQKLRAFERELLRGLEPAAPLSIGKLLDGVLSDYAVNARKSAQDVAIRIEKHLRPWFGGMRADRLRTADIREYVAARQKELAANGTINRELTVLQRAFNLGRIGGEVETVPYFPKLKEATPRQGFFEEAQLERVLACLPEAYRPFVRFLYLTGWRVGEVRGLCWRHVDFEAGEVRLDAGDAKNGESRTFPMTVELRALLEAQAVTQAAKVSDVGAQRVAAATKFVFTYRRWKDFPLIPIGDFGGVWARACAAAGLAHVVTPRQGVDGKPMLRKRGPRKGQPQMTIAAEAILHDFRRTAVRNLVRAGIPERVAMQLTGHKTRSVFDRYQIVSRGDLQTARDRLDLFAKRSQSNISPFRKAVKL